MGILALLTGGTYRMRYLGAYFIARSLARMVRALVRLRQAMTPDKDS